MVRLWRLCGGEKLKIKLNSAHLKLELGLSLAKRKTQKNKSSPKSQFCEYQVRHIAGQVQSLGLFQHEDQGSSLSVKTLNA